MAEENVERKSKIVKSVERVFTTQNKYETVRIGVSFEEEIVWSTPEERQKKLNSITTNLINDYDRTKNSVMEEMGLQEKKAYVESALNKKEDIVVNENVFDSL
jgi:hypothetical protein